MSFLKPRGKRKGVTRLQPESSKAHKSVGGSPVPGITLRHLLRGHKDQIARISWSPDGRLLASPSVDTTVRIWDAERGEIIALLKGHKGAIISVAWSPDGRRLASGSLDKTVRIWDVDGGQSLAVLESHEGAVTSVAWSPDGRRLASGSLDKTVRLRDSETLETLAVFEGHEGAVTSVAWSPDGRRLASGSLDKTVRIWDPISGTEDLSLKGHAKSIYSVTWAPNRSLLASGGEDNTIRIWDVQFGAPIRILEGHTRYAKSLSFSSDGSLLASKADDGIRLWRTDTWETQASWKETGASDWYAGLSFHPLLPCLATLGEKDRIIRIWELDEALLLDQVQESVHYTTAKLVLVGDSGVGKTGLGWRLAHGEFKEHASTHGQQFWPIKELGLKRADGTECEAVLWDLAGQHAYRQIHSIFLENVAAALVLFDPSNRQEPLRGVQFWLEQLKGKGQLPPVVLVGARVDVSPPALSQQEFEQFCQRYGIRGGYISTSAKRGEGIEALLETLKAQIPWDEMTATVTTVTFKRIKDYVLSLKEKPDRKGVLVSPLALREQLQATDEDWRFTDAEMMTAVGHLETHGYVTVLRNSAGEQHILLTPELLVTLASSVVFLADKNPRELGAVSETELLQGAYPFDELTGLAPAESQILLDAAILRFLAHNICFRETLGDETLLIFPALIKQKRPLQDDLPSTDDISYVVRGRVENVYAGLVVLLGYTPSFTRINQWQNQAQYEMGEGEICGFRLIEDREGEIELVLYYSAAMPAYWRTMFQGLFERFLYQRDVEVTRFPPVFCPNGHRQERDHVVKRIREGKEFLFCDECGEKIPLSKMEQPLALGAQDSRWIRRQEALAHLRSTYETHLVRVKGFRRSDAAPRCYISHLPEQASWAAQLARDLRAAGVFVLEDRAQIRDTDYVIMVGTYPYRWAWQHASGPVAVDAELIRMRFQQAPGSRPTVLPLLLEGDSNESLPRELGNLMPVDFRDETYYASSLFNLVLTLYNIPFNHPAFEPLRDSLHRQWEQTYTPTDSLADEIEQMLLAETNDRDSMEQILSDLRSLPADEYQEALALFEKGFRITRSDGGRAEPAAAFGYVAKKYRERRQLGQARWYYRWSLRLWRNSSNRAEEARALNDLGELLYEMGNVAESMAALAESERAWRALGDKTGLLATLNNKTLTLLGISNVEAARDTLLEAVGLSRELGDLESRANALHNLGAIASQLSDWGTAEDSYKEALEIFRSLKSRPAMLAAETNLGHVYANQRRWEEALGYYQRGRAIARQIKDQTAEAAALSSIGRALTGKGDLSGAEIMLRQALSILQRAGDNDGVARVEEAIADIYRQRGDGRRPLKLIVSEAQRFLQVAGFQFKTTGELGSFLCQPVADGWKRRFKTVIYVNVLLGQPLDRPSVLCIHEAMRKLPDPISHAFVVVDQIVEDDGWLEIAALRAGNVNVMPIPLSLLDENKIVGRVTPERMVLAKHLERFLGRGFDPYNVRDPISDVLNFFGREALARELIDNHLSLGKPVGLFGLRKIGKSSLMRYMQRTMPCPTAWLDLQIGIDLTTLYERLLRAWDADAKARFKIDLGLKDVRLPPEDSSAQFFELIQSTLRELGGQISEARLAVFLDEIELIMPPADASGSSLNLYLSLMRMLRGLVQEDGRVSLMVAGVDPTINRINRWAQEQNPFYQLLQEVYLPPLSHSDCIQMVRNIGRQVEVTYTNESADLIARESGGHPFLARQLCSLAYRQRNRRPGEMQPALLENVADRFLFESSYSSLLNETGLWGEVGNVKLWGEQVSRANQEVLLTLARSPRPLAESEITGTSSSNALRSALFALQQYHIIDPVETSRNHTAPRYAITFGLFREWLRRVRLGLEE